MATLNVGRPRKLNKVQARSLVSLVKKNGPKAAVAAFMEKTGLKVSAVTAMNYMKRALPAVV